MYATWVWRGYVLILPIPPPNCKAFFQARHAAGAYIPIYFQWVNWAPASV